MPASTSFSATVHGDEMKREDGVSIGRGHKLRERLPILRYPPESFVEDLLRPSGRLAVPQGTPPTSSAT